MTDQTNAPFRSYRSRQAPYQKNTYDPNVLASQATGQQYMVAPDQYHNIHNVTFASDFSKLNSNILLIDSADRNWEKEDNNNYIIHLNRIYQNVHSIQIVGASIPNPSYSITAYNNVLCFQETQEQVELSEAYSIEVTPGNYDITTLLNTIKTEMEAIGGSTYTLTVDAITEKVTIATDDAIATGIFNLIFSDTDECINRQKISYKGGHGQCDNIEDNKVIGQTRRIYRDNSIGKTLGFRPINLTGSLSYTGQMVFDLVPFRYLGLFLDAGTGDDEFRRIESLNNNIDGAFTKIGFDTSSGTFNITISQINDIDDDEFTKYFNPPLREISRLRIQFRTPRGKLFNFEGLEHTLMFKISTVWGGQEILTARNDLKIQGSW